jgi:Ion channel
MGLGFHIPRQHSSFRVHLLGTTRNQFYHSTVQYEQSLNEDADAVLAQLRDSLIANFRAVNHVDILDHDGYRINITDLQVYALRPTVDRIGIKMTLTVTKPTSHGPVLEHFPFEASYAASEKSFLLDPSTGQRTFYKVLSFDPPTIKLFDPANEKSFDYGVLFPHADGSQYLAPFLALPEPMNDRIQGFWRATRGLPSQVSGGFWRMFYLSAVTITTVGYGDIVPLTTTARLLVSSEAILGIVVIGLFLNSLVRERSLD